MEKMIIQTAVWAAAYGFLIPAAVRDMKEKSVPTAWIFRGAGAAIICAALRAAAAGAGAWSLPAAAGALLPGAFFATISFLSRDRIGAADPAAVLLLGLLFPARTVWVAFFASMILISAASLILIAFRRAGTETKIPYLPFLTVALTGTLLAAGIFRI